jgi:hypothetical protein
MEGAPLKEDAGWEDYDLGLQLLLLARILTAGASSDTRCHNWESQMAVKRVPLS